MATPIGLPLLPIPDAAGRLRWNRPRADIADRIRTLLLTRRGELLGHPRLGAGLGEFLHQGDGVRTRRRLRDVIVRTLAAHERRIVVQEVRVDVGSPGELQVTIVYRFRHSDRVDHQSLTLTLDR